MEGDAAETPFAKVAGSGEGPTRAASVPEVDPGLAELADDADMDAASSFVPSTLRSESGDVADTGILPCCANNITA